MNLFSNMNMGESEGLSDLHNLKGYRKSEIVLQELKKEYKQRDIEKRQGMKLDEHSKRLANFATELD